VWCNLLRAPVSLLFFNKPYLPPPYLHLHLHPSPLGAELLDVQAALVNAFPQCTDLSCDPGRGITAFTPHLSLGQWRTAAGVAAAAATHQAGAWQQPLRFQAGGVALISRAGYEDPFSVQWFVPFGGGDPVQLGVPYIATVGPPCAEAAGTASTAGTAGTAPAQQTAGTAAAGNASDSNSGGSTAGVAAAAAGPDATAGPALPPAPALEFGLGAALPDGSVWVFSYGANTCPRKLSGVRGVQPLESLPASLPGWRLAFTHRGGMGNVEPLAPSQAGPAGLQAVHGVLHRLSAGDYGRLINMEHEYRCGGVEGRWVVCLHVAKVVWAWAL